MAEKATKSQIYHIGHEDKFSNLEIAEKIGEYLGLKDYISFEKDRLINDTIYPADSLDMMRDFHWHPTRGLDDFLPETIEWYRKHLDHFRHRIWYLNTRWQIKTMAHWEEIWSKFSSILEASASFAYGAI